MHVLKVLSLVFIFDLEGNNAQQEFVRWNFSSFQELKVSYFLFYLCVCDEAPQSARGDECARLFYETHVFFLLMIKLVWPKFSEKVSFFITFFSEHEFWCHHIRMHVHWEKVVQLTRFLLMFAIFCCSWQHFLVTDSILSLF